MKKSRARNVNNSAKPNRKSKLAKSVTVSKKKRHFPLWVGIPMAATLGIVPAVAGLIYFARRSSDAKVTESTQSYKEPTATSGKHAGQTPKSKVVPKEKHKPELKNISKHAKKAGENPEFESAELNFPNYDDNTLTGTKRTAQKVLETKPEPMSAELNFPNYDDNTLNETKRTAQKVLAMNAKLYSSNYDDNNLTGTKRTSQKVLGTKPEFMNAKLYSSNYDDNNLTGTKRTVQKVLGTKPEPKNAELNFPNCDDEKEIKIEAKGENTADAPTGTKKPLEKQDKLVEPDNKWHQLMPKTQEEYQERFQWSLRKLSPEMQSLFKEVAANSGRSKKLFVYQADELAIGHPVLVVINEGFTIPLIFTEKESADKIFKRYGKCLRSFVAQKTAMKNQCEAEKHFSEVFGSFTEQFYKMSGTVAYLRNNVNGHEQFRKRCTFHYWITSHKKFGSPIMSAIYNPMVFRDRLTKQINWRRFPEIGPWMEAAAEEARRNPELVKNWNEAMGVEMLQKTNRFDENNEKHRLAAERAKTNIKAHDVNHDTQGGADIKQDQFKNDLDFNSEEPVEKIKNCKPGPWVVIDEIVNSATFN
eukprot:GHVT01038175.1.p1 GENE.GHVT01038175.1~~GHVT01038175.1.p1  ORF type:complete len:587 (+),score=64.16 GHVT01038175.1:235-1995(+)